MKPTEHRPQLRMPLIESRTPEELLGPLNDVEQVNAPRELYFRGDLSLLRTHPRVSIVGARKASETGLKRARKLAKLLAAKGVVVVSGLAEGIDTVAHTAAIEAKGRTIAVLGTPIGRVYPPRNAALQAEIERSHLAISQFPPGRPTTKASFPMRNRTMALVSEATVIVEAADTSGSLHQGWEALRLGRPLFMMESVLSHPGLSWPKELLRYGAQILADDNFENFLHWLLASPEYQVLAEAAF